jgi:hypothetical protein
VTAVFVVSMPGRSLRLVKLLPMNRMRVDFIAGSDVAAQ